MTRNFNRRQQEHRRRASQPKNRLPITYAIRKYGFQNLQWVILQSHLSRIEACHLEQQTIKEKQLTNKQYGYNLTAGGDGGLGYSPTPETREKLSKALKGRNRNTPAQLTILSTLMSIKNQNSDFIAKARQGREHSNKYRKWSQELGKLAVQKFGKSIICVNEKRTFRSIREASRYYQIEPANIRRVLKGKSYFASGYHFVYS